MHVLYYQGDAGRSAVWRRIFAAEAPEITFHRRFELAPLDRIECLITWQDPGQLLERMPKLKWLYSTGAGADQFDLSSLPPGVQLIRMIEPGIEQTMVEYATLAVLSAHRHWYEYLEQQRHSNWTPIALVPAAQRRVGVMGLGVLGQAVLAALARFGFDLHGWSRTGKSLAGVKCFAGRERMPTFLACCDILICLLPLTAETRGILNAATLARLPRGAALINIGRGGEVDQDALLQALDSGQISRAILDVTDPEPLPPQHPLWRHPRTVITPHVCSTTRADTAARAIIANLRRIGRGEAPHGLIDPKRGY